MEENVVIAVTLDGESSPQNPAGYLIRLKRWLVKIIDRIHNSSNPASPPEAAPVSEEAATPADEKEKVPTPTTVKQAASPSQPPNVPERPTRRNPIHLHPIIAMIRQQELGKSMLSLGAPITIALLVTSDEKFHTLVRYFVLTGLSAGCTSIWIGLAAREAFPESANVFEQAGIIFVLVSFNAFIAAALPLEFAWVPMICGGLCIATFVVAAFPHQSVDENMEDGD